MTDLAYNQSEFPKTYRHIFPPDWRVLTLTITLEKRVKKVDDDSKNISFKCSCLSLLSKIFYYKLRLLRYYEFVLDSRCLHMF
jgi:type II secretory pathway component PulL